MARDVRQEVIPGQTCAVFETVQVFNMLMYRLLKWVLLPVGSMLLLVHCGSVTDKAATDTTAVSFSEATITPVLQSASPSDTTVTTYATGGPLRTVASVNLPETSSTRINNAWLLRLSPAPAGASVTEPAVYQELDSLAKGKGSYWEAVSRREQRIRPKSANYFKVVGNELRVFLANGDQLIYDRELTELISKAYRFVDYLPGIDSYLLIKKYQIGSDSWMLINRQTGKEIAVSGKLYLSPGRTVYVAAGLMNDPQERQPYQKNRIQFNRLRGNQISDGFELNLSGWGIGRMQWLTDSTALIEKEGLNGAGQVVRKTLQMTLVPAKSR